tara:strand:- start:91 stop:687 length:597 start_codon:yes stop_codon:yes gene_type:complete
MKILESRLRQLIRKQIREFISTGTGMGGQTLHKGRTSKAQTSAETDVVKKTRDYDASNDDYATKKSAYDTHVAAEPHRYRYRVGDTARGAWVTIGTDPSGKYPRTSETNPTWTTWQSDKLSKDSAKTSALATRNAAKTAKGDAETKLTQQKASDLERKRSKIKPPSTGATYATGRTAGKAGKGKGKGRGKGKKGRDEE